MNAVLREPAKDRPDLLTPFSGAAVEQVLAFHRSFPEYAPTPLADLKTLAQELGVGSIHVKDESFRFELNAFKVLGGSYCIGKYMKDHPQVKTPHFVTATDGNHGRGIAWMANRLGCPCTVYMPRGSAPERLKNIRALGAEAEIIDGNYDDAVRLAWQKEQRDGWVMVQDTAWPGYETIPRHIMQGYTTMAWEAGQQLAGVKPTHLFLQAGVGAMAGAVAAYFCAQYPDLTVIVAEPHAANCYYRTAKVDDGKIHIVDGDMTTIMAGLACGEPCTLGWEILSRYARCFVSMEDEVAAMGMRLLGRPIGDDPLVVSGESGAAGLGCAAEILLHQPELKQALGLTEEAHILCFSTEGDTDQENYRKILGCTAQSLPL